MRSWLLWFYVCVYVLGLRGYTRLKMNNLHLGGCKKALGGGIIFTWTKSPRVLYPKPEIQLTANLAGRILLTNLTICIGAFEGRGHFGVSAEKIFLPRVIYIEILKYILRILPCTFVYFEMDLITPFRIRMFDRVCCRLS